MKEIVGQDALGISARPLQKAVERFDHEINRRWEGYSIAA